MKEAAKLIQGGGGGQPHFATAGGKNTDGLNAAIEKGTGTRRYLKAVTYIQYKNRVLKSSHFKARFFSNC